MQGPLAGPPENRPVPLQTGKRSLVRWIQDWHGGQVVALCAAAALVPSQLGIWRELLVQWRFSYFLNAGSPSLLSRIAAVLAGIVLPALTLVVTGVWLRGRLRARRRRNAVVGVFIGATLALASVAPRQLAAQTRTGWWIEIRSTKARAISVLGGSADTSRMPLHEWRAGQRKGFDLTGKLVAAPELYLLIIAAPKGAATVICLHYKTRVAKHISFDDSAEKTVKRSSIDDARECR